MTNQDETTRGAPDAPLSSEEQAVQRLLQGIPDPEPRAVFRDRLRRDFVEGRVPSRAGARRPLFRTAAGIFRFAIPAIAVVILLALWANRTPQWRLLDTPAGTRLILDGKSFDAGDTRRLLRNLRSGTRLQTSDSTMVTLSSPGNLAIQVLPGTDMTLPGPPGRWFARTSRASIASGEMHITTARGFHGAHLFVDTPELEVEVVGTTVAVIRPEFGTCICVLDGTVMVAPRGGKKEPVSAGHRFTFFREEERIDRGDILPMERTKLGQFQSLCAPSHEDVPEK